MTDADVAIISSVYGGYDDIWPAVGQVGINADWIMVTDDPRNDFGFIEGWTHVYEPRPDTSPMRAAKRPKFMPWLFTDAPATIWIDGAIEIRSRIFAAGVMDYVKKTGIAQFGSKNNRDCLYDEAMSSFWMRKYRGEPIIHQALHYKSLGHPEHWGLWTASVIARMDNTHTRKFGEQWQAEVDRWSFEDQVSEPFVLRNTGLRPETIPIELGNAWLRHHVTSQHGTGKHDLDGYKW